MTRDVDLGDLTYNASVANIVIANISVAGALLYRGNNTLPFRSQLFLDTIVDNIRPILGNSTTFDGGNFNMVIKDGQCVIGGQHIPWVESVLAHSPLAAAVPLTQLLQNALGSVLGSGTGAASGETTNDAVDRLLAETGVGGDTANAQTRDGPSGNVAADVVKAAKLYRMLTSHGNARGMRKLEG